ncbi:hypothetical protein BHM03_00048570 [Ensete ventricosum]|nr:hypothetical protein BHM03_00048570 [Ensete ventricosum]
MGAAYESKCDHGGWGVGCGGWWRGGDATWESKYGAPLKLVQFITHDFPRFFSQFPRLLTRTSSTIDIVVGWQEAEGILRLHGLPCRHSFRMGSLFTLYSCRLESFRSPPISVEN